MYTITGVKIFLPVHDVPLPLKPGLQEQLNDSTVSIQVAFLWQLCVPLTHSFSTQNQTYKDLCFVFTNIS